MRKIRTILGTVGVVILLNCFSSPGYSVPIKGSFTIIGPRHFERITERPATLVTAFTAPKAASGYTLRLFNGGDRGQFRPASSAVVVVNGKTVLGPSDFNPKISMLERAVSLNTSNEIAVEVRGGPGTGFTILIDAKDTVSPTIEGSANPLPNANGWNNSDVTVRFKCEDAFSGIASCSDAVTVSREGGRQEITGAATDNAGNTSRATVSVSLDKTMPGIIATPSPSSNSNGWNNGNVTVTFACSDGLSGIGTCPSAINITNEGANQAGSGESIDRAGNSATASSRVSIDKTAPGVSIEPVLPATVFNPLLSVTGAVSDALSGVSGVTCNGAGATVSGTGFACTVNLTAGANTISVSATDNAGNSKVVSANVNLLTFVPPPLGPVAVSWLNPAGVAANANSLTKTDATNTWNSGASSKELVRDGYGFVEFTATETNTYRIAGLGTTDSSQDYTDVDYGVLLRDDTSMAIYEDGAYRGEFGPYASGDTFRVEVLYGVVRYLRNGVRFYTTTVPAHYPLRVDTALRTPGATLTNVRAGHFIWTNAVAASISGTSLVKTGAAGWTAGAVSTNTIETGDGYLEFSATETNTTRLAGLANLDTGPAVADIQFGVQLNSNGTVEVVEGGTSRGVVGGYAGGDRFRIELRSGVVRYYRNGVELYTSLQPASYPLRADASLDSPGATLTDVILEQIAWQNTQGVYTNGPTLIKTMVDGWTGFTSSTRTLQSGDGFVEFTPLEINKRRALGLKVTGAAQSIQEIDFAVLLTESGNIEVLELGTSRGLFGAYQNGDRFRIEIQNGVVRYRRNGVVFYSSGITPTYPLHAEAAFYSESATLFDVAMGDLVWMNEVNARVVGRTLLKTNTTAAWNAGAVSSRSISSGYMELTASETSTYRIAGLSSGDANQNYTDIDFGLLMRSDTTLAIYEAGVYRGEFGTYATGDRFRVEVQGGVVRYRKNGTLLYTSTVSPALPLRIDTSINGAKGTLFNVVLN